MVIFISLIITENSRITCFLDRDTRLYFWKSFFITNKIDIIRIKFSER